MPEANLLTASDPPKPRKHPVSAKQMAANRRNARLSTGPKSPEGKMRVASNALKHGLFAKRAVADGSRAEEFADYKRWRAEMYAYCAPVGPLEESVVDQLAYQRYRLAKLMRHEEGASDAKVQEIEKEEQIRMGNDFSNIMHHVGDQLTYEYLTTSSRGVSYLLRTMDMMDEAVAAGCPSEYPMEVAAFSFSAEIWESVDYRFGKLYGFTHAGGPEFRG